MNLFRGDAHAFSSERLITLSIVTIITVASTVLMLLCASPEFSWDEADYVASSANNWSFLWGGSDYGRHGHGPLTIYLAKLGQELLPAAAGSLEGRLRFFEALVGSVAVGLLYLALRRSFRTSHGAALVGSSLLLFSVIRLEETNLIGPHHLMLACTLAIVALGYQWRDKPTLQAAIGLGAVMGFGALSMTSFKIHRPLFMLSPTFADSSRPPSQLYCVGMDLFGGDAQRIFIRTADNSVCCHDHHPGVDSSYAVMHVTGV